MQASSLGVPRLEAIDFVTTPFTDEFGALWLTNMDVVGLNT